MDHGLDQGRGSEFFDDRSAVSRPENRGGFMMRKKLASLGMTALLLVGLVAKRSPGTGEVEIAWLAM